MFFMEYGNFVRKNILELCFGANENRRALNKCTIHIGNRY